MRVAVVGVGAVGACVGYHLSRAGITPILVDAGRPGELTTSASLAWVNASAKAGGSEAYFELNFAGLREYERLVAELGGASWWHRSGHLRWDYPDEHAVAGAVEQLRSRGYPAELWETERAQRLLEPHVAFESAPGVVALLPAEGWVDGRQMVHDLVAATAAGGGLIEVGSAVSSIGVAAGAVASIGLADGRRLAVDAVVNAAGPAATSVAALVERELPMLDAPGLAVRIHAPAGAVRHVLHAPGIAIRPDGAGRAFLLARSVETVLCETGREAVSEVLARAAEVIPRLAGAAASDVRVGRRPIPADGLPAIGRASRVDGYYEAVTHSGITLAPILGRLLANEIVHGRVDPLVAQFRAARLAGG